MNELKIGIIADIHYGPNTPLKLGSSALPLLGPALDGIREANADVVVDLGDRITDIDGPTDERNLRRVAEHFKSIDRPVFHLFGNHDVASLSPEASEDILGCPARHSSVDMNGWHLVFWQVNSAFRGVDSLAISEEDIAWLEKDLASTDLPAVVFTHIPLDGASMEGNYYFERNPTFATFANAHAARAVLAESSVVASVAGHVHWNAVRSIGGVHYFTVQSLTECFTTYPSPAASWGTLELGENIRMDIRGNDSMIVEFGTRKTRGRWLRRSEVGANWAQDVQLETESA